MRQQAIRYTISGVVAVILAIALTFMVNWLSARRFARADWTSTQIYTLSEKTENILAGLDDEIRIVVFMTPQTAMYRPGSGAARALQGGVGQDHGRVHRSRKGTSQNHPVGRAVRRPGGRHRGLHLR